MIIKILRFGDLLPLLKTIPAQQIMTQIQNHQQVYHPDDPCLP